jgi:hypothetical protein
LKVQIVINKSIGNISYRSNYLKTIYPLLLQEIQFILDSKNELANLNFNFIKAIVIPKQILFINVSISVLMNLSPNYLIFLHINNNNNDFDIHTKLLLWLKYYIDKVLLQM